MFELLTDGTIEHLCMKFKYAGIPYGFGGMASIGAGKLPAEFILKEHYSFQLIIDDSRVLVLSMRTCV